MRLIENHLLVKGHKSKKAIITIVLVLAAVATNAQKKVSWKPFLKAVEYSQRDFVDTIRVKIESGAVIVPVEIAGQERHLLFDTGAEHGFWFGNQEDWMRPIDADSTKWRDINGKTSTASLVLVPEMRMGRLGISNYPVSIGGHLGDYICGRFDGLIGFDLVTKGLSVKLDTKDSLLIVTDRKGSEAYEKGVRTGDLLIEADGIPIDDVCTYVTIRQRKKPGEEIHFLFRSPDGTEKRVAIISK